MLMCIQNLIKFCSFVLKILSGKENLRSFKGRNSVANLRKMTIYNTNIDLVNDNVYTKFVKFCPFILKILEKKMNYDGITELQINRIQKDRQGKSSIAPTFSKRGYNDAQ